MKKTNRRLSLSRETLRMMAGGASGGITASFVCITAPPMGSCPLSCQCGPALTQDAGNVNCANYNTATW